MRLLISGSRDHPNLAMVHDYLDWVLYEQRGRLTVIHGKCKRGVDAAVAQWACTRGVEQDTYPVDHAVDGNWPSCGPRRNQRMVHVSLAHRAALFHYNNSPGTESCRKALEQHGIPYTWFQEPHPEIVRAALGKQALL